MPTAIRKPEQHTRQKIEDTQRRRADGASNVGCCISVGTNVVIELSQPNE